MFVLPLTVSVALAAPLLHDNLPNPAECLTMEVRDKDADRDKENVWDVVTLRLKAQNGCEKGLSAFSGVLVAHPKHQVGGDEPVQAALRVDYNDMPLKSGEPQKLRLSYQVWDGGFDEDIWLFAAPFDSISFTWIPTLIVFDDGSVARFTGAPTPNPRPAVDPRATTEKD